MPLKSTMATRISSLRHRIEYEWPGGGHFRRHPIQPNVIKYGAGADLLIHEVAIAPPALLAEPFIQRIMAHHTTASEAGRVVLPSQTQAGGVHASGVSRERADPTRDGR
jgi:hypothetical protein